MHLQIDKALTVFNSEDETVFNMQKYKLQAIFKTARNGALTGAEIARICKTVDEAAGIQIPIDKMRVICEYDGAVLFKIQMFGLDDTEVQGSILNAVANFFLCCQWPTYGDDIDIERFVKTLQRVAAACNFVVKQ